MKKLNLLFLFVLLIIPVALFCGCNGGNSNNSDKEPIQLSKPILIWEEGKITWAAVENAAKYEISFNDQISYSYNTFIDVGVTNYREDYRIKVKSISENPKFLNSDFSELLTFNTLKLASSNLSKKIDNQNHKVTFAWGINYNNELYIDEYEFLINNKSYIIPFSDVTITNQPYTNTATYTFDGNIFVAGKNSVTIQSKSDNPYYLSSDISTPIEVVKNPTPTNIRLENDHIVYDENSIFDTSQWDAIFDNSDFPIVNKSGIDNLWSEPAYIRVYKIHAPKIINCEKTSSNISFTIEGFDHYYSGTNKRDSGFDYDTIEVSLYCTNSLSPIVIYLDSQCLDIETFNIGLSEITQSWFNMSNVTQLSIVARKTGYLPSKAVIYKF